MKKFFHTVLLCAAVWLAALDTAAASTNAFFPFCIDWHDAKKRSFEEQAAMLKELGYAGVGHVWLDQVAERLKTLDEAGLKLFQITMTVDVTPGKAAYDPRFKEVLALVKGRRVQFDLLLNGRPPSDPSVDPHAVEILREMSDLANDSGAQLLLYPHQSSWVERIEDAVRVAEKVDRPNVGVMFNLCHWLRVDPQRDYRPLLQQALPRLWAVSINGADEFDPQPGWDRYIQPLDRGNFDVATFLRTLHDLGYRGPIGLQCYGIGGDARDHLARSMAAWRDLTKPTPKAGSHPLREAVECRPRGGLPNVGARLEAGQPVRVAYFGGSITAAAGWRVKTLAWLQSQYPQARLSEINAAIGGTGSDLGVYRFAHDVLRHKPDLVFVEFAVNDGGAEPLEIHRGLEGIVRQCWTADPTTDLCFVYTITGGMMKDLHKGVFPRAASAMEAVADRYAIPSLHFGVEVAKRAREGSLVFQAAKHPGEAERQAIGNRLVFSNDDVHPLDAGHEIYAQTVARHFPTLAAGGQAGPHALPEPLVADHYQGAVMLPLESAALGEGWTKLDPASDPRAKSFSSRLPGLYRADQPGTRLSFRFKGTAAGVYDLLGPDCGQLTVVLDGGPPRTVARIDGYCTYHRLAFLRIAANLPDTVHTVDITLDAAKPDKASILFPENRQDLEKDPAKYDGSAWYAGGLMLIGELLE
ncbi:MAG: TIM barrel protein [Limisphaerales bacterium]